MKPVRIDFIPDQRWRTLWAVALLLALFMLSAAGWRAWQTWKSTQALQSQIALAQHQAQPLQAQLNPPANPRHDSLAQAARLLRQDLGKAFAMIENLKEEGVRLRAVNLDANSGTLQLEYEIDTLARAATVTALLNAGYETRPWRLESVGAALGGSPAALAAPTTGMRALWVTQLERL
ncbi:hypothetical protein [Rhodoferax sp.]|uniref:hypothetical protein n=1 Tax=Rhodoferax sp. TaxID=50421 RepID=UPI0027609364|nr:hypothetical protein [Rhodoferax sp.]